MPVNPIDKKVPHQLYLVSPEYNLQCSTCRIGSLIAANHKLEILEILEI